MIDFENGFGKWIASVPAAAVVCCEAAGCVVLNVINIVSYLVLELLFSVGDGYRSFGEVCCCVDGGSVFFRNGRDHVPD
jgi:hypothetical protein